MGLASAFYEVAYRYGSPRWDRTAPTPEVVELAGRLPVGRALDLGCGTGTNCLHLAQQGWSVVGVDFSATAIARARGRGSGLDIQFVQGDVANLHDAGVDGAFDLIIDVGCFHGLSRSAQERYAQGVAALARPGAALLLLGVEHPPLSWRLIGATGALRGTVERIFDADFEVRSERVQPGRPALATYRLVRRAGDQARLVR